MAAKTGKNSKEVRKKRNLGQRMVTTLTESFIEEFCSIIQKGLSVHDTCNIMCIDHGQIMKYIRIGEGKESAAEQNIEVCKKFAFEYRRARDLRKASRMAQIERIGTEQGQWSALAYLLGTQFPEEFGTEKQANFATGRRLRLEQLKQAKIATERAELDLQIKKLALKKLKKDSGEDESLDELIEQLKTLRERTKEENSARITERSSTGQTEGSSSPEPSAADEDRPARE